MLSPHPPICSLCLPFFLRIDFRPIAVCPSFRMCGFVNDPSFRLWTPLVAADKLLYLLDGRILSSILPVFPISALEVVLTCTPPAFFFERAKKLMFLRDPRVLLYYDSFLFLLPPLCTSEMTPKRSTYVVWCDPGRGSNSFLPRYIHRNNDIQEGKRSPLPAVVPLTLGTLGFFGFVSLVRFLGRGRLVSEYAFLRVRRRLFRLPILAPPGVLLRLAHPPFLARKFASARLLNSSPCLLRQCLA